MAEFYRFFDSTLDDIREYSAEEYSEYFRMVLTNGIYNGGTNLQVSAKGSSLKTIVADGYAMINGYLYKVKDGVELTHDTADVNYDRIDRVVLRWDVREESRFIKAIVLKGVASEHPVEPTLTRTDEIYELSLAQVVVKAGSNNISGANVTDERLNTEVCGIFNSRIQADTTEIFNQFQAWYNEKIPNFENAFNTWYASKIPAYEKQWTDWFKNQTLEGFVTNADIEGIKTEIKDVLAEEKEKVDVVVQEATVTNTLKVIKSEKDAEGIFTVVTYKRKADDTIYCVSTLSGGESPLYTTRTEQYYDLTGTSVTETFTYTLSYDEDGNLVSEV